IRDKLVTGVQTCALPIFAAQPESSRVRAGLVTDVHDRQRDADRLQQQADQLRDEVARERDAALAAAGTDAGQLSRLELATGTSKIGRASCRECAARSGRG